MRILVVIFLNLLRLVELFILFFYLQALMFRGIIVDTIQGGIIIIPIVLWLEFGIYRKYKNSFSQKEVLTENYVESERFTLPELKRDINLLIRKYRGEIPFEALAKVIAIKDNVVMLLPHLENMNAGDYDLYIVTKTITDYLPETLMRYSELPKDFAENHKIKDKIVPVDILMEQLDIMEEQIQKIADNINNKTLDSLIIQGDFLKSKFSEKS